MIIALGYRVQSQIATRFRRWATRAREMKQLESDFDRAVRELAQRNKEGKDE